MDKDVVVHIYNGILFSHKKEHIWVSSSEVNEPRDCYTEWSKSEREKPRPYTSTYTWNLENGTDEPIFRAGIDTQTWRTDLWPQQAQERGGRIERVALKHMCCYMWNSWLTGSCRVARGTQPGALWQPRGADGVGGRRDFKREGAYVCLWQSHADIRQKPAQHRKAIILQSEINKFLKKLYGHMCIFKIRQIYWIERCFKIFTNIARYLCRHFIDLYCCGTSIAAQGLGPQASNAVGIVLIPVRK